MTEMLILAQSVGVGQFFAGTVVALPIAALALLAVMIGQWPRWRALIRVSRWLSWFVLTWNPVCCALTFYKEWMPFRTLYDLTAFVMNGGLLTNVLFFGPSTLLAVIALLMIRKAKRIIAAESAKSGPKCEKCGYLLIGLEIPRCPECGTPFDPVLLRWTRGPAGLRPNDSPASGPGIHPANSRPTSENEENE